MILSETEIIPDECHLLVRFMHHKSVAANLKILMVSKSTANTTRGTSKYDRSKDASTLMNKLARVAIELISKCGSLHTIVFNDVDISTMMDSLGQSLYTSASGMY